MTRHDTTELRALAERMIRKYRDGGGSPGDASLVIAQGYLTLAAENAELKRQLAEADHAMVRAADVLNHTRGLKVVYDPNDPPTWAYITNEDDEKRVYFYALNDLHLGRPSDTGKE